ncbi:MAG: DUF4136 domain-containing protein [Oleiphilaceae bacterium]|nr:DUF4136 domain-containing protein [Oleiphilaceae bacterium]
MLTKLTQSGLLIALAVLISACQAPQMQVLYEQSPKFGNNYKSFKVVHTHTDIATEAEKLLNEAIANVMLDKGYVDGAEPDFVIQYSLRTQQSQRLEFDQAPTPGVLGRFPPAHPPHMEAVFEARMLVNVIESSSGDVVWKAATTGDLTQVNVKKFNAEKANARMQEMFADFPTRFNWWF